MVQDGVSGGSEELESNNKTCNIVSAMPEENSSILTLRSRLHTHLKKSLV
jgi:hypothetical protein